MGSREHKDGNWFGLVRYLAAFGVMMLHFTGYWRIYRGIEPVNETFRTVTTFFPPVVVFFAVSGYLNTASLEREGERQGTPGSLTLRGIQQFLKRRLLRIYPPLWLSTAFYLVFYIICAGIRIDRDILVWLGTQVLGLAYTPEPLEHFATESANGVLWTIGVMIQLYVLSAFLYPFLAKCGRKTWAILLVLLTAVNLAGGLIAGRIAGSILGKLFERTFLPYAVWYGLGAYVRRFRETALQRVRMLTVPAVLLMLAVHMLELPDPGYYAGIVSATGACLAALALGTVRRKSEVRRTDITYELYLYQWAALTLMIIREWYITLSWPLALGLYTGLCVLIALLMHLLYRALRKIFLSVRGKQGLA